ncbi:hypothetical protein MMC07_007753 [Pseudocyphellaria aurata]|nr:hypothetical protein [Pseudocyphellaria aurata]
MVGLTEVALTEVALTMVGLTVVALTGVGLTMAALTRVALNMVLATVLTMVLALFPPTIVLTPDLTMKALTPDLIKVIFRLAFSMAARAPGALAMPLNMEALTPDLIKVIFRFAFRAPEALTMAPLTIILATTPNTEAPTPDLIMVVLATANPFSVFPQPIITLTPIPILALSLVSPTRTAYVASKTQKKRGCCTSSSQAREASKR